MCALLAVDAGVRTGLALLDREGRLLWCRSHNLGSTARLKNAAARVLFELPQLEFLVVEGGGQTAGIWEHAAAKRNLPCRIVQAQDWREQFLLPRQRVSGQKAKAAACALVGTILRREGWSSPTTPGHDAAEAALVGLWAAVQLGWRAMPALK
ncbi:hypothetical protein SAMN05421830_10558 [Desulfomicrobium norvegicum]|uniref:Uncharacterized protein n=1 Tax=Desulfomicrobium norvegicum (strain DSM 1741 / NCIMB 8310) TaxID=52561 RepID=A0A8G2C2P2_DESNO|nr:hypothetical protein [Desulfomicrobium norvegicum]SFL70318.1 hypothetical protein SAMN05421830_10558 [Desulfomicrobium norvegicum]